MRDSLKRIWGVARCEFIGWVTNPRIIIVGILFVFIKSLAIDPLSARAEKFGEKMIAFETFIAVGNSGVLTLFILLVFLVLISDYPRLGGNSQFYIFRTGKKDWLWGQFLFLVIAVFAFMGTIMAITIIFSGGTIDIQWSEAVRKYASRFTNEAYNFDSELLSSNLYNQIPMMRALWQTAALMSAYLFVIALVIYLFKMLFNSSTGVISAAALIALGTISTSLYSPVKWAFPSANVIIWLHYTEIYSKPIYPMRASFVYFAGIIILLAIANFFALKN